MAKRPLSMEVPLRHQLRGPSRRRIVGLTALGAATALIGSCSTGPDNSISLWYWSRSVSKTLMDAAPAAISGLSLSPVNIGGDFHQRLLTTLAGKSNVPDITGMNSDVATYMPDEDQFVDLYDLGARDVQPQYLDWKWKQGVSSKGRLIAFPMDTGPAGLFYRADVWEKAGLPAEPSGLAKAAPTWEAFLGLGVELRAKVPRAAILANIANLFTFVMAQSPKQYLTSDGQYIGDGDHVRRAWDLAVMAARLKLSAASSPDYGTEWSAGVANGRIVSFPGAVWTGSTLSASAPTTAGKWRVTACPGGAGNQGGSFLAITKYCPDPQLAFDFVRWLQSPPNQVRAYSELALFPSTPASYGAPELQQPDPFFGGQKTIEVFGPSAEAVKPSEFSPYDTVVGTPLTEELVNVESLGKNPDRAWSDAQKAIARSLDHAGVV